LRLLFDHTAPAPLRTYVAHHEVVLADDMGWGELTNGLLLAAAEECGFDLLVTADKNIRHQQNLAVRLIGILVLPTNKWRHILEHVRDVVAAIDRAGQGVYQAVDLPREPLVRRPPPAAAGKRLFGRQDRSART
jgi:hypothetical protein